jgi:hypothetical protein
MNAVERPLHPLVLARQLEPGLGDSIHHLGPRPVPDRGHFLLLRVTGPDLRSAVMRIGVRRARWPIVKGVDAPGRHAPLAIFMIRKRWFQMLRPACARFQRIQPRSVQQRLDQWSHRDSRDSWAGCPILLLPLGQRGHHGACAEQRASPRTCLEMQSTWRTSQYPAGVATQHGADKIQAAAPNAGLGSRRAQSPFPPSYLSTEYPQVTFHRHARLSRRAVLGNLDDRQVADEHLSTTDSTRFGNIMAAGSFSLRPGPATRPIQSPPGHRLGGILGVSKAYQDATQRSNGWQPGHLSANEVRENYVRQV